MLGIPRAIVLAILGIIAAVFVGFVATPREAAAPSEKPAAILPAQPKQEATTTPKAAVATTSPKAKPAPVAPKPSVPPTPTQTVKDVVSTVTKNLTPTTTPAAPIIPSLNDRVRSAIVNINCVSMKPGGLVNSVSASGVLISPNGVILTNSHVAQYLLLKDYPTPGTLNCIARTGSPATPAYTVQILFMPPSWMRDNAQKINDAEPTGNGEHDYALLQVTGSANPAVPLPASLPYLPLLYSPLLGGENVIIAGYAAGFLGGTSIAQNLYASSSFGKIREILTFNGDTADLLSLGGSIVAQQGSSGGAVANEDGNLVGIIVTSTIAPDTASRNLSALSVFYIANDFQKERGLSLAEFMTHDLAQEAAIFALGTLPTLIQELLNALQQGNH